MLDIESRSRLDLSLLLAALLLWLAGIALVYSATQIHETGPLAGLGTSQIVWVVMALLIILLVLSLPSTLYHNFAYVIYGLSLLLLVLVIGMGVASKGASRWLSIGGLRLQPSEFAKIGLLLVLARYFARRTVSLDNLRTFVVPLLLILPPFALVLKQPDLGTAGVMCAMSIPMFFWAGLSLSELFLLLSPGISFALSAIPLVLSYETSTPGGVGGAIPWGVFFIIVCVFLYVTRPRPLLLVGTVVANLTVATITNVLWALLKDYQKMRVISFIDPNLDANGAGYQVIQSMVAIGSGHITGKGYLQGTQTRLSFLPEQHTDFIFSVLGEQFGFVGCSLIILLMLFLVVRALTTAQVVQNRFNNLVIVGAATIIAFHIFVNIAMTLGMMPVTGIPLPFLSYGGSFTFTVAILVGFILNARFRSHDF
jgi:rod shape determining protein RodA